MFRAHVLIVRKSKLYYTASGIITLKHVSVFDVTTSNVSFLRESNTQLRDVTAGPFTAGPLSDVTPLQCTADPTPEPHGRTRSRGLSHSFWVPIRCHVNSLLQSARLKLLVFFFLLTSLSLLFLSRFVCFLWRCVLSNLTCSIELCGPLVVWSLPYLSLRCYTVPLDYTAYGSIVVVKRRRTWLVLRWLTAWEHQMMLASSRRSHARTQTAHLQEWESTFLCYYISVDS